MIVLHQNVEELKQTRFLNADANVTWKVAKVTYPKPSSDQMWEEMLSQVLACGIRLHLDVPDVLPPCKKKKPG